MKKILQTLTIAVTLGLTGCNDSYLERLPTTEVTEATAFTSFTTCSNYLTNLYQMFSGGYNFERLQGRRCLKNGNVPNGEKFFRQTKPI